MIFDINLITRSYGEYKYCFSDNNPNEGVVYLDGFNANTFMSLMNMINFGIVMCKGYDANFILEEQFENNDISNHNAMLPVDEIKIGSSMKLYEGGQSLEIVLGETSIHVTMNGNHSFDTGYDCKIHGDNDMVIKPSFILCNKVDKIYKYLFNLSISAGNAILKGRENFDKYRDKIIEYSEKEGFDYDTGRMVADTLVCTCLGPTIIASRYPHSTKTTEFGEVECGDNTIEGFVEMVTDFICCTDEIRRHQDHPPVIILNSSDNAIEPFNGFLPLITTEQISEEMKSILDMIRGEKNNIINSLGLFIVKEGEDVRFIDFSDIDDEDDQEDSDKDDIDH